jgi:cobalt-zinc-cadmium efflux system membrane fusion protein
VDTSKVLCVVANVTRLWLTLDVRLEDAQKLRLGQAVRFRPDGIAGEVSGVLSWLSTGVNRQTRTVKVRADIDNHDGKLRDHTFGTGRIILREEKHAVVVPNDAVHWDGDCHLVFVRDRDFLAEVAPKVFHVRQVRIGARDEKWTEVVAGVLPGEIVAGKGSGVLRAELMKNNLGEGCGCHK